MQWKIRHMFVLTLLIALAIPNILRLLPTSKASFHRFKFNELEVKNLVFQIDNKAIGWSASGSRMLDLDIENTETNFFFCSNVNKNALVKRLREEFLANLDGGWRAAVSSISPDSLFFLLKKDTTEYRIYFWVVSTPCSNSSNSDDDNLRYQTQIKFLKIGEQEKVRGTDSESDP